VPGVVPPQAQDPALALELTEKSPAEQ